jgi:hypothetical protein
VANLVVALIALASFLGVVVTLLQGSLAPQPGISSSWKQMRSTSQQAARTSLDEVDLQVQASGAEIRLAAANTGGASLHDFDRWDVIVNYRQSATSNDFTVRRLTYTSSASPADNQWTVAGIYRDAVDETDEVFDPGILDPDEEIALRMRISPGSATSTPGQVLVATENGVTLSAQFVH